MDHHRAGHNLHSHRPWLPVVLKCHVGLFVAERRGQIGSLDLANVRPIFPPQLPIVGHRDRQVAKLPDRAEHRETGQLHGPFGGRRSQRLLRGEIDLHRPELLLGQLDGHDLGPVFADGRRTVDHYAVARRCGGRVVGAVLHQQCAGRQAHLKSIKRPTIATDGQARVGANAVAIDRNRDFAGGAEDCRQLRPLAGSGIPTQAKIAAGAVNTKPRTPSVSSFRGQDTIANNCSTNNWRRLREQ